MFEFDELKTKDDIQCKLYDDVDLDVQDGNKSFNDQTVQKLLSEDKCWSEMWMEFGILRYPCDNNSI